MQPYVSALLVALAAQSVPFTLERLELDLAVDHANERVEGTARLTIRNVSSAPASEVPLLLNRLMTVTDAGGLPFVQEVFRFEDDSKRQVEFAAVHLKEPLAPGASTTVSVSYGGHIASYEETGMLYVKDRVSVDYTIIREDAYAFPVLGVPSIARDRSALREDFPFAARVRVPRGFTVASGGFAGREDAGESSTFRFASAGPAPFVILAVAKFRTLEEGGVTVSYLPADEEGARRVLLRARQTLALFEKWFGPPPSAPKVALIEIPSGWGSQAHLVSGIYQTADAFRDPKALHQLYHEVGHLWNPRDLETRSARWNEGLSTWLQHVVAEELDGRARSPEAAVARVLGYEDDRLKTVPFASYGEALMTDYSYGVGHLFFLVLEKVVGREALLAALRDLVQAHRTTGVRFRDLTALLESRFPKAAAVDADWVTSTAWVDKLKKAGSIEVVAAGY